MTSEWVDDPIGCIFQLRITRGTGYLTFSPKNPVTREQMAAFMARTYRYITR